LPPKRQNGSSFELVLKGHVRRYRGNGTDATRLYLSQASTATSRRRDLPVSTFNAVEFSKTEPLDGGNKKASDSHQRPSKSRYRGRIRSLEGAPFVE